MSDRTWRQPPTGGGRRIMARPAHQAARSSAVGSQRPSRRRAPTGDDRRRAAAVGLLIVAALLLVALFGLPRSTAQPSAPSPSPGAAATAFVASAPSPPPSAGARSPSPSPGRTRAPATVATSAPLRSPRSTAAPATPQPTRHPNAAPASAAEFDIEGQVIAIAFPLKERDRYRYRDNFGDPREGHAEAYNHARSRSGNELLRAHDGIDIYAPAGVPVVAPFDGVVVDPSARWRPWIAERYGLTAAIVSGEPTSEGYTALLTHLEAVYVEPGQRVHRGEVVGTVGDSGNAEGGRPHVHFELRAPFPLSWQQVGEDRLVDAFNPYPSLRAADPKRSE